MSLIYQAEAVQGRKSRSGLYIGGKEEAKDLEKLKRWNISHILNVTPAKQTNIQAGISNYFEKSFVYKRIDVMDNPTSASDFLTKADSIVDFIVTGLCHGSVLVHCHYGISRSTTAVLFYLMRRAGMSLDDGLELIRRRRPQAQPIPAFLAILRQYEAKCYDAVTAKKVSGNASKRQAIGPAMPPEKRARTTIGPALPPTLPASIEGPPRDEGQQEVDKGSNKPKATRGTERSTV